nr:hypothetical protein [Cellulosimicrobium sp. MM]
MQDSSLTTPSAVADGTPRRTRGTTPRAWAWTGVVAGVLGLVSIQSSMALGINWEETAGDAEAIVADLSGRTGTQVVFHTATIACALLVLVFAAGLKRRLDGQAPAGSILPTVAGWGLVLVSVAGLLGSGLDTQFLFGLGDTALIVPESGAFYSDWVATIPWLWVGRASRASRSASRRCGTRPHRAGWASSGSCSADSRSSRACRRCSTWRGSSARSGSSSPRSASPSGTGAERDARDRRRATRSAGPVGIGGLDRRSRTGPPISPSSAAG